MSELEDLAQRALDGDRGAVERLVRALEDDVFNLALKMLGHPQDAEDATQEILTKVITRLGSFRGESGLRTWVWSVASNHLLNARRGRRELPGMDFDRLGQMLDAGLAMAAQPPQGPGGAVLEEEVKLGCTQTMLSCLDREHRLAFILSEIFDMSGAEGAEVLGIEAAAFRKRVSRARQRMRAFMVERCGLVARSAPCRCRAQVTPSLRMGLIDPAALTFVPLPRDRRVQEQYEAIESVHREARYRAPERLTERLRDLVRTSPP